MINDLTILRQIAKTTKFQSLILANIDGFIDNIDLLILDDHSFINIDSGNLITLSLLHKEDIDTNVTLNIFADYATLWYTSCKIHFDDYTGAFDVDNFREIYKNCLLGNYTTTDYYLNEKLIYSSTRLLGTDKNCVSPNVFFSRFYIRFFAHKFIEKQVTFKPFM